MLELRPYQQEALETILSDILTNQNVLLQAATGAGKTIIFSALIKYCLERYKMRIGVIAHREQLVRQARDKLVSVWPEGKKEIGIACASVSNSVEIERPVVIGSPQTLINRIGDMPPLHMLIVDECHRLPPVEVESQYGKLINKLREYYPQMRLVGVTATPYRLNHGYIYGGEHRSDESNWWTHLSYSIGIKDLQDEGFLVKYRGKATGEPDLSGVKKSGGEFNLHDLGEKCSQSVYVKSAIKAVQDYAEDRKHIVVFATTIEHAEILNKEFNDSGYKSVVVHSKQPHDVRLKNMEDFDKGKLQVICNVGVLTEGWDCTAVDCMVMCRPTMSPALFVQMVGRGLRLHEGKDDCLLLDLSGNWKRHGDPCDPKVTWVQGKRKKDDNTELPEGESEGAVCPKCNECVSVHAIICPNCGEELKTVENKRLKLYDLGTTSKSSSLEVKILKTSFDAFVSKAGNRMIRVSMCVSEGDDFLPMNVNYFLDIEGQGSDWGRSKAVRVWTNVFKGKIPVPNTVDEAVKRISELVLPDTVFIVEKGKYWNVKKWGTTYGFACG